MDLLHTPIAPGAPLVSGRSRLLPDGRRAVGLRSRGAVSPVLGAAMMLTAGVLYGTIGTAKAVSGVEAAPVAVGAVRILVGGLVLFAAVPALGGSRRRVLSLWRRPTVLAMSLAVALYQILFFVAMSTAGVALGTLVAVGAAPVLAGLAGWAVLNNRPARWWVAATAVAIAGLVLRSWGAVSGGDGLGIVVALGAALCIMVYNTAIRVELLRGGSAVESSTSSILLGGLLLVPLLLAQPLAWVAAPGGAALVVWLGVVTAAIAGIAHAIGLRGLGPGPATTFQLADPVVATALGVLVLGEAVTPVAALGVALVIGGLALQALAPSGRGLRRRVAAP